MSGQADDLPILVSETGRDVFRRLGVRPTRHLGAEVFSQLNARWGPFGIIPQRL